VRVNRCTISLGKHKPMILIGLPQTVLLPPVAPNAFVSGPEVPPICAMRKKPLSSKISDSPLPLAPWGDQPRLSRSRARARRAARGERTLFAVACIPLFG
jgi:hypothetical protein